VGNGAWDALTIAENRHPALCALTFELENVGLVVADLVEELVPDRPPPPKHRRRRIFRLILLRAASCLSVITGSCIFFAKADAP